MTEQRKIKLIETLADARALYNALIVTGYTTKTDSNGIIDALPCGITLTNGEHDVIILCKELDSDYYKRVTDSQQRYNASCKGKEARERAQQRYIVSDKGKEARKRARQRYIASDKGKQARKDEAKRYAMRDNGKRARQRARLRYRIKSGKRGEFVKIITTLLAAVVDRAQQEP